MNVRDWDKTALFLALAIALALRLVWAWGAPRWDPKIRQDELWGDAVEYHHLALSLLKGEGFALRGSPTASRPPGYPIFLAGVYFLTGPHPASARWIQALLGVAAVWLTILLTRQALSREPGLRWVPALAGLMVAFHPLLIYCGGWVYGETLGTVVTLCALLAGSRVSAGSRLVAGALAGLGTLIRPQALLMIPGIACARDQRHERPPGRATRIALPLIAGILVMLPWTLRNVAVLSGFIPLTTTQGANLWGGNNPDARGGFAFRPACPAHTLPLAVEDMSEPESDRFLTQRGLQTIKERPLGFLLRLPLKLKTLFSPVAFGTSGVLQTSLAILLWPGQILFLCLAGAGLWRTRSLFWSLLGWHSVLAGILLSSLVFFGSPRFLIPGLPLLCAFAAVPLSQLLERLPGRR